VARQSAQSRPNSAQKGTGCAVRVRELRDMLRERERAECVSESVCEEGKKGLARQGTAEHANIREGGLSGLLRKKKDFLPFYETIN